MNRNKITPFMLFSILGILLLATFAIPAFVPTANATDFILLYSNDIHGETEPCG